MFLTKELTFQYSWWKGRLHCSWIRGHSRWNYWIVYIQCYRFAESSPLEFALTQTFHHLLKEIEQDSEYVHSEETSPLKSSSSFLESTSSSKDLLNSTQEHLSLPSPTLEEIQNLSDSDSVSSIGGICLSTQEDSDTSEVPPQSPKRHIQFEDCEISQINFCDDPETTGTLLSSPKLQFKNSLISNIKFIEDSLEEDIEMAEAKKKS